MAVSTIFTDSFIQSATGLDANGSKSVWQFIEKFRANPAHPGLSLERVKEAASRNVWSGRVGRDLRAILYQEDDNWLILYVGHHDDAYHWAASRQIERHVKTGQLQIVELPTVIPTADGSSAAKKRSGLFAKHKDDYLLSLGVPAAWLPVVRAVATEDDFLDEIYPKLPGDVAERLFLLASGETPAPPAPIGDKPSDKDSAGAWQNFYLVESDDDLRRLLAAPMAAWIAFLHPSQKRLATGAFNGPVKVTGAAGTGKTVVAMHRARHQARQGKRVLLTSFVKTLCSNLKRNMTLFCDPEDLKRITVTNLHNLAKTMLDKMGERLTPVGNDEIGKRFERLLDSHACPLDKTALLAEWEHVIQAQGVTTWEQYRAASRAGRGRPLSIKDRKQVWEIVSRVYEAMEKNKEIDYTGSCRRLRERLEAGRVETPFDAVIVDEVQDLGPQELRLIAALSGAGVEAKQDRLTLVGDGGQRIYAAKFSLRSLGIDVRGRSHVLRLNYRTTEQIRRFADQLFTGQHDDLDGGMESRRGVRSLFRGPQPVIKGFANKAGQTDFVVEQIKRFLAGGRAPDEIAVFVRQAYLLNPIEKVLKAEGIPHFRLSKEEELASSAVSLGTMHRAKGLEFKVVFVVDASDDQLPLAKAIADASDDQLREDVLARERQLLYVSATRARDELFVCYVGEPSRFLKDLKRQER
ncbi:MAG: 3'-5' exonuclease [Burkholderiales bacterium]